MSVSHTVIDTVLVKVAARCNLACDYCYFFYSEDDLWKKQPKMLSTPLVSDLCSNLEDLRKKQNEAFAVVLHGGEPLLIGEERLAELFDSLRAKLDLDIPISIQTNGVLISNSFLDLCSKYHVSVSVSIDGPKEIHDNHRLTHSGRSLFSETVSGIQMLVEHPDSKFLFSGTLSVVNPESEPAEVYEFLKGLGSPCIDFLYRDGNHTNLPEGKESFDSTEYGDWFVKLFNHYCDDPKPPRVRILDDIVKLLLGSSNRKEGIGLSEFGIIIIDSDGSLAKNDTLKNSHSGADRFDKTWNISENNISDVAKTREFEEYSKIQTPTSEVCRSCQFLKICGGGMPLYRWKEGSGYSNPSVYCNDHQLLIRAIQRKIKPIINSSRSAL